MSNTKSNDVFICHASEDKETFVRPLANFLSELGVRVWYDEFSLQIGKSISRSIDSGLAGSKYGVIVLSPRFFNKAWTEYELKSLNAIAIDKEDFILPVWLDVDRGDVLKFSPYLADKLAVSTATHSLEEVAFKIFHVVCPDLSRFYNRQKALESLAMKAQPIEYAELAKGKRYSFMRHATLSVELINRIRLIRICLIECYPVRFEDWVEGFKRDLHPEKEVEFWESVCYCYMEIVQFVEGFGTIEGRRDAYRLILAVFSGLCSDAFENTLDLPKETIALIKATCHSKMPLFELDLPKEDFPDIIFDERG